MKIQSVNNSQNFKGLNIYRAYDNMLSLGLEASPNTEEDFIKFIDCRHISHNVVNSFETTFLGTSPQVKEATEKLKTLGSKITGKKHIEEIRELLGQTFSDVFFRAKVSSLPIFSQEGQFKSISDSRFLNDVKVLAKKGIASIADRNSLDETAQTLSFSLKPEENVSITLNRGELAKYNYPQPE